MTTATKIELTCRISVRRVRGKGKSNRVTDCGIYIGDAHVATRTFVGEATARYCLAQFRRTGHSDLWRKSNMGWEMYQSFKSIL